MNKLVIGLADKTVELIMETEASRCTYEDAEMLAEYEEHVPGTNAFNASLQRAMAG